MITKACRECETWEVKDIIYVIGSTSDNFLRSLWMVYGDCYAADEETYEKVKTKISEGIHTIPNVEFSATKELGKVKRIDPLGITGLRIRGMWHIEHPQKVFAYLDLSTQPNNFQCIVLMKKEKYHSFPEGDRQKIENHPSLSVQEVQIKNPNNPVQLLESIMITYQI